MHWLCEHCFTLNLVQTSPDVPYCYHCDHAWTMNFHRGPGFACFHSDPHQTNDFEHICNISMLFGQASVHDNTDLYRWNAMCALLDHNTSNNASSVQHQESVWLLQWAFIITWLWPALSSWSRPHLNNSFACHAMHLIFHSDRVIGLIM